MIYCSTRSFMACEFSCSEPRESLFVCTVRTTFSKIIWKRHILVSNEQFDVVEMYRFIKVLAKAASMENVSAAVSTVSGSENCELKFGIFYCRRCIKSNVVCSSVAGLGNENMA